VEAQVERAKIIKPSGRADLNPNLGYPDFEPAIPGLGEKEKEEDKLSAKVRRNQKNGFCILSTRLSPRVLR
jgi:hypothetical protein